MESLIKTLTNIFKDNNDFIDSDGNVLKEKIKASALKLDSNLLDLLLKNNQCKTAFFKDVNGVLIFDKTAFIWMLNNAEFLPSSYSSYKTKIGLIDDKKDFLTSSDDIVLSFPFKDCVLEFDSTKEDDERFEVFINETLGKSYIDNLFSPKVFANVKKHTKSGAETISCFSDENLVIKGNNLIALHSLLPRYEGKIKLMYWDILFNTNNDIVPYNDSFKHSSWLTMMKNRIEIGARLLNKENGFFVIECDKNEDAYLTVLMDELLGRDNHICTIAVKSNNISGNKTQHKEKTILKNKDSILVYSMSKNPKIIPQYTEKTRWDTHYNLYITNDNGKWSIEKFKDVLVRDMIISPNETIHEDILNRKDFYKYIIKNKKFIARYVNSISPELKKLSLDNPDQIVTLSEDANPVYAYNGQRISFLDSAITEIRGEEKFSQLLGDLWTDIDFQNTQNEGSVSLPAGKKPEFLLQRIISMLSNEGDIVLDAYFGSGTTGAVAMKLKRRFIGIEQLNSHFEKSITRLEEVIAGDQSGVSKYVNWNGGGSFISAELANENNRYIDEISKINDSNVISLFDELVKNPFYLNYQVDIGLLNSDASKESFCELSLDDKKRVLLDILDKNLMYVNYSDIKDSTKTVCESDVLFTKSFYKKEEQ